MRTLSHEELLAGLHRISPSFSFRGAVGDHDGEFYPGAITPVKSFGLYFNFGPRGSDAFICGVSEGRVGPFDVVNANGKPLIRGWREVMRYVVLGGYAAKSALEDVFRVELGDPQFISPEFMRCGCQFNRQRDKEIRDGALDCAHEHSTNKSFEATQRELALLPGVTDDRFYPYQDTAS